MMNNNKCISIEEAKEILEKVKEMYPGIFDRVNIRQGTNFMYSEIFKRIYIADTFEEYTNLQVYGAIDHINNKYGLKIERTIRNASIQALLHELGHHKDFLEKKEAGTYREYREREQSEREEYEKIARKYYNEEESISIEKAQEINKMYREIISEVEADKFSAKIINKIIGEC